MKKIIIFLLSSMFFFSQASAIGINVGVSGSAGVFHAEGKESENNEISREDATGVAAYSSIFAEVAFNDRLALGVSYVPQGLESETANNDREDLAAKGSTKGESQASQQSRKTNKVQVDFNDLTSLYATLMLTENLYVKGGFISVDIATNESLGTGSTYNDTDTNGYTAGLGYNKSLDNGLFVRVEGMVMEFDTVSVTSSNADNQVTLDGLSGATGTISIGKSF